MPVFIFDTDISIAKWSTDSEWKGSAAPHQVGWPLPVISAMTNMTTLPEYPDVVPGEKDLGVLIQPDVYYHYGTWRGRFDIDTAYNVPGSQIVLQSIHWQGTNEDLDIDCNPLVDVTIRARVRTGDLDGGTITYNDWSHDADDIVNWYQDGSDINVVSGRFVEVECYFMAHLPDEYYGTQYEGVYFTPTYFDYHYYDPLNLPEGSFDPGYISGSYYIPVMHNITLDLETGPQPPEALHCVIDDVCVRQLVGTTTVEITYTLQSASAMTVELSVTDEDGTARSLQPNSGDLSGDIGINVSAGNNTMYWAIGDGTAYDNSYLEDIRVVVGARNATYPNATCHATSHLFDIDSEDPIIYGIKFDPIVVCEEGAGTSLATKTVFRMSIDTYDRSVIRWVKFEYDVDATNYHSFYSDEFSAQSALLYEAMHDFDITEDGEAALAAGSLLYYRVTVQDMWGNDTIVTGSTSVFNDPPEAASSLSIEGSACAYPTAIHITKTVPVFNWEFNDPNPGDRQGAWRVQVNTRADFTGTTIWDSGKVLEPLLNGFHQRLASAGPPEAVFGETGAHESLLRCHNFYWRVKTWDMRDVEGPWSSPCKFYLDPVEITVAHDVPLRIAYGIMAPEITTPDSCDQLSDLTTVEGLLDLSAWSAKYEECTEVPDLTIEIYADNETAPIATGSVTIVAGDFDQLNVAGGGLLIDGEVVPNGYYGGQVAWSVALGSYSWSEGSHTIYAKVYDAVDPTCKSEASDSITFVIHTAAPIISVTTKATHNKVVSGAVNKRSPITDTSHVCYSESQRIRLRVRANAEWSTAAETSTNQWSSLVRSLINHSVNTITVVAENAAGLSNTLTTSVIYETNTPEVYVDNQGVISTRTVTGTFVHDGGGGDNYSPGIAEITVNGVAATFSETFETAGARRTSYGTWTAVIPSLLEGPNKVMLEIIDKAGNRSRGYQVTEGEGYAGDGQILLYLDTHRPSAEITTGTPINVPVVRGVYSTEGTSAIVRARIRVDDGTFVDLI